MRSVLLFVLLLPTLVLAQATQTQVLPKLSICVFDPLGANGSLFNTMKDYHTTHGRSVQMFLLLMILKPANVMPL